jgi:hypothetical protein
MPRSDANESGWMERSREWNPRGGDDYAQCQWRVNAAAEGRKWQRRVGGGSKAGESGKIKKEVW